MNKSLIYLSAVALWGLLSCSQPEKSTKGYQINGVTSIKTSMAYLINNQNKTIDSAKVSNHKFHFTGEIDSSFFYTISFKNHSKKTTFILENSNYEIAIRVKKHLIIGGKLQEKFNIYKTKLAEFQESKQSSLKLQFTTSCKEITATIDSISTLEKELITQTIKEHLTNDIARFVFENELKSSTDISLLKYLLSISKSSQNNTLTLLVEKRIQKAIDLEKKRTVIVMKKQTNIKKGKRPYAPMFSGEALQDGDLSLATVLNGKKAVLIDFWASWCGPCRQLTPFIKSLHEKYKEQGFTIITISEDKTRADWRNGVFNEGMSEWNHIFDDSMRIAYMFNVGAIPHMVLLDGQGGIVKNKISINDLEGEIQKLIK